MPDIHRSAERLQATLLKLPGGEDGRLIGQFADACLAEGISAVRTLKYVLTLQAILRKMPAGFKKADKGAVMDFTRELELSKYAAWTKHDYKVTLKKFFRWLRGSEEEYPPEVRWIKSTIKKNKKKMPEELLTREDVEKLVGAADNLRDKALVSVLYESGCRPGELLGMQYKHVSFDRYGAVIMVFGKTGAIRKRLIESVPWLFRWWEAHPLKRPDSPVWLCIGTTNHHGALGYSTLKILIKRLGRRAKLEKRVYPYIFRHSRATHVAPHLTEAQMDQYFGWVMGSVQPSTYIHLSGRDTDPGIFRMYGIKETDEEREKPNLPIKCPRCTNLCEPGAKFCARCGMVLDLELAMEMDDVRRAVTRVLGRREEIRESTPLSP